MSTDFAAQMLQETLKLIGLLAGPVLLACLVVGVMVGLLQAITQIHEMTLTFIPKMVAVALALLALLPWMLKTLSDFSREILLNFPQYLK